MEFDIFFSFSKMDLGQGPPSDRLLYDNLFQQIRSADELGFNRAWIGEAHFSIRTEQHKPEPLLPHFNGELCINTDILQIASVAYPQTKRIEVGSAIRNIIANGGPVAHAEAVRTYLTIHQEELRSSGRKLNIGFGIGRFAYANEVYGFKARNRMEELLWPAVRALTLREAAEIFVRMLSGETLGSEDITPKIVRKQEVKETAVWSEALQLAGLPADSEHIVVPALWGFQRVKLIPEEVDLSDLNLVLGSHDPQLQQHINQWLPVKVFNLSVTPNHIIDQTHERMRTCYHSSGGAWKREYMPRTVMVFTCADEGLSETEQDLRAEAEARDAMHAYWQAMEGTVDQGKVESGMENAVYGSPAKVFRSITERFHPNDCLMTWFDFNTNDADVVIKRMKAFMEHVAPLFKHV
jgi:alkanesulfonate monooxygenase SsuD/methylene tetrahydromethanopterin reductase-like flavin-dependent oxidoreductase (luciferase family)